MRPTDFPDHRLRRRCPGLSEPGGGSWCPGLDQARDPLLDAIGEVVAVLGDRLATVVQLADRFLDLAAALAQFALDAHARFAHVTLEAVAGGRAATLEATQLCLGLGR